MPIGLLAGLILAATFPAAARGQAPEPPQVCVSVLIGWSGNKDDRQHIETTPVPESLKKIWLGHDCAAGSFDHNSLLEWHLKFGSPQSTMEALSWVETTSMANVLTPGAFRRHAAKDLEAAKKGAAADTDRANRDIAALDAYAFLAGQYLRAAEFFHSPVLLAKAKPYVDVSRTGLDLFYPGTLVALQSSPEPCPNCFDPQWYEFNRERELPLRYAIEQAYQTGSPQDLAKAQNLLDQTPGGRDLMSQAAYQFSMTPKDPCDGGNGPHQELPPTLAKACDTEQDLTKRLVRYWRDRAMLDLVLARSVNTVHDLGLSSLDIATELFKLTRSGFDGGGGLLYTEQDDELIELYLADAEATLSRAREHPQNDGLCEPCYFRYLNAAVAIVSPVLNPNRFRQLAAAYAQVCLIPDAATLCSEDPYARQEAYLRFVASHLNDIDKDMPNASVQHTRIIAPPNR
jgi:hypothetical protein